MVLGKKMTLKFLGPKWFVNKILLGPEHLWWSLGDVWDKVLKGIGLGISYGLRAHGNQTATGHC